MHQDYARAMSDDEGLFRAAGTALEVLVRSIVRDELRKHLGSEGDYLMNIRHAPMSQGKLRRLISDGAIEGFKHGREVFVRASDFRAYVERKPVAPRRILVPEPPIDPDLDELDAMRVQAGTAPRDPEERKAFELRLARRRAGGGERAESLARAERRRIESEREWHERQERLARRAAKRAAKRTQRKG